MDFIIRLAEEFFKKHKRLARYRRIFAFLAAVVVFATTYELILPAITMDGQRALQSPGVEVGVAKDQRKGIEFMEDDSFAVDTAGEDAFEAGFPEEGDYFEDDAGAVGDGYAEDYSLDETQPADDWMQPEDPATGDTWKNAEEIVPGAENTGDDYSGSDESGSFTDENGTDADNPGGDVPEGDLSGADSDFAGADVPGSENDMADPADENGTDAEEAGLESTGSDSYGDGQDMEAADGENASDASVENTNDDNKEDASAGASGADNKTDDQTGKDSGAGSSAVNSGEAVIEGGTAETTLEYAQDGAAVGATDLAALGATGQAAIAVTYPATIVYEGKDYTITATFD